MSVANDKEGRSWTTPTLKSVGTIADVLKGGGGKLTVMEADTGDSPRQPKGQVP